MGCCNLFLFAGSSKTCHVVVMERGCLRPLCMARPFCGAPHQSHVQRYSKTQYVRAPICFFGGITPDDALVVRRRVTLTSSVSNDVFWQRKSTYSTEYVEHEARVA